MSLISLPLSFSVTSSAVNDFFTVVHPSFIRYNPNIF
nr:MAG TPA: hypothetical protein [Caudoviricetes sp.]